MEKIKISAKGLDIHYYFDAIPSSGKSDILPREVNSPANVLMFRARGTRGLSVAEIARTFGCSKAKVLKTLRQNSVASRPRRALSIVEAARYKGNGAGASNDSIHCNRLLPARVDSK